MMTLPTEEERVTAYRNASGAVRDYYAHTDLSLEFRRIAIQHNIPQEKTRDFVDAIGDIFLGFFTPNDLPTLLSQVLEINIDTARKISGEFSGLFISFTERVKEELQNNPRESETDIQKKVVVTEDDPNKPLTREELLQRLSPKRAINANPSSLTQPHAPRGYDEYKRAGGGGE